MNQPESLIIGTRGSPLALWQAEWTRDRLAESHPGLDIRLEIIHTKGDKILDAPLAQIGGKGLFTREIERALIDGGVDLAVHSLKDLPTVLPEGLALGCVCEREDPRDALVAKRARSLEELPAGARVATSSLRRRSQLLHWRPDLDIVDIRGNVGTRIAKLQADEALEATIMARAGLTRMKMDEHISAVFEPAQMLPAVSQGALGIETREGDERVARLIAPLEHVATRLATSAERAFLRRLEGGCTVPVAALARVVTIDGEERLTIDGLVASLDGILYYREGAEGRPEEAEKLGTMLAERLIDRGAGKILESIRHDG